MDIKVYGTDTSGHQLVMSIINDMLSKAKISFQMSEVNNVSEFLSQGIESVPAIQLNKDEIYPLKSNGSFNSSLRSAINKILTTVNYGDLSKFLIPIDFSDPSLNALSFGHRLSTDLGAITQVMHVYRPRPKLNVHSEVKSLTETETYEKVNHIVEMLDKDWGGDIFKTSLVSGYFKVGFPTEKILDLAEDNDNDLLILGSTGSDNKYKKWIGSVSSDVISKSCIPVLLIPEEAKYRGIPSIMVGIDKQPLSESMAHTLSNLCTTFGATIHLVHVGQKDDSYLLSESKRVLSQFYMEDLIITEYIESENVLLALDTYARLNEIEIIAVTHKTKGIFSKLSDESITHEMSNKLDKPLLVLK